MHQTSSDPPLHPQRSPTSTPIRCILHIILYISMMLSLTHSINFKELTVVSNNYIIGQTATYEIIYDRTQQNFGVAINVASYPVSAGSTLTLNFPVEYTINSSLIINAQVNSGAIQSAIFTLSGNLITVTGLFPTQQIVQYVTLTIRNVQNPTPAIITSPFTGTIGNDISISIGQNSLVQLSPATFKRCYMTFDPKYVNRTSSMIFNLTSKTKLPLDSYLQIQFDTNIWTREISPRNFLPITSSNMPCGTLSPNVKSTITCLGVSNKNKIIINNLFNTDILSDDYFAFEINNFKSPPTNQPVDIVKVTAYTIYNGQAAKIDTCADYVTDLIPNQMISSSISITTNTVTSLIVNRVYTLRFAFDTVDTFHINDYFEIKFPDTSNFVYNSNSLSGGLSLSRINSVFTSNVLRLYMNTAISIKTYAAPYTMFVVVGLYTTPPSTQTTAEWKFSILRNGFPMQVGYKTLTPAPTTLTASLTNRTSDIVNRNTSYTFSIKISDALSSAGKIRVRFPSQLTILTTSTTCATISGTSLTTSPLCIINTSSKTIDLTIINSTSSIIPLQTFTLTIDGIRNPSSTINSGNVQIRTYYKNEDTSLVAIGIVPEFISKQATINAANVLITASSYKVLDRSVTYSIRYNNENEIPIDGWIRLYVPKPILINVNVLASSCKRGINANPTQTTTCVLSAEDSAGYLITFTQLFVTEGLPVNANVTLELSNLLTNAPSTAPASSFKLFTFSSNTFLISKIETSLAISMTDPTVLSAATYTKANSQNYQLTVYDFTLKQIAAMQPSSVIHIQFPADITANINSKCTLIAPFLDNALSCILTGSTLKITLPVSSISSNTAITVSITNIRNPSSFRPPGDFIIRTFTSASNYKYANGITSNKVSNSVPSRFGLVEVVYSPRFLDTSVVVSVSFEAGNQAPGYLQVSIPAYFVIINNLTCSQSANFDDVCASISQYTLNVSGNFPLSGVTSFQISGFKSSFTSPPTNFIILNSFTADGYQLDQSNDYGSFTLECTMPCKTCDTTNTSLCKSCYQITQITDKVLYDQVTNFCYSNCPNGYFENYTLLLCIKCDLNCLTCQGQSTFCLSCIDTSIYKYLQIISITTQSCVNTCNIGFYPDLTKTPFTCTKCINRCATCTSANICLTCDVLYFLWNSQCIDTCPSGITVPDSITRKCEVCQVSCKTCEVKTTDCTSCTLPLFLYSFKCISECISPTVYRTQLNTCGPCDTQCKTCDKTPSNCTSCEFTSIYKYYHLNKCLIQCPDLYYELSASCALCSSLSINCDYCINSTACEICNLGFVYLNGACLGMVPAGYVNVSGQALPCTGDCATCVVTQSNCTACKTLNLNGNVCQTNCPAGSITLNRTCTKCEYPCRTCAENIDNCTSCLTNQTPELYLIENRCQLSCPTFYYPDNGTNKCNQCQIPCQKCSDLTVCTTCVENRFLYTSTSCLPSCPLKFVGINKVCEACIPPCKTCIDSTTKCLNCDTGYFYLTSTNKCLLECGQGLFQQYTNQTCIACTEPCKTCVNTTDTCLSCLTGILLNNACLAQCPQKMYNFTNICFDCPITCKSCLSTVNCLSCTPPYLLYENLCIEKCPDTHAVVFNAACTKCSDIKCHKCLDSDFCYNCVSGYSLLKSACLALCPSGYKTNGTHCLDVIQGTLQSGSLFPVPFTISTSVVLIAVLMSKLQFDRTFLSGGVFGLLGLIETLALLYYIYLYYVNYYIQQPIGLYIALGALGLLYLLNILSILQSIMLSYDKKFSQWRDTSIMNKCFNSFSIIVSILLNHKFKNLMFSRLFAFHIFSAMVDDMRRFKIFNIFSFISLVQSGGAIFSVITIIKISDSKSQFFHACLDLLIITSLNIIFAFLNAIKGKDFFDEMSPEGLLLNKKVFADEDQINGKIQIDGNDVQNQFGVGYYSKIQHTLASNNAFRFNKESDDSRQDLRSDESLTITKQQKQYEQISIQAYQILDDKQPSNRIDFSTLKADGMNISKFTNVFQNQDKSIQNTIEYNGKVNQSIQKYTDNHKVSLQRTKIDQEKYDQSIQYSQRYEQRKDQSIAMTNNNRQVQGVSVQGDFTNIVDHSNQYSLMMSDKGIQKLILLNDISIQQQPDMISYADQMTIQYNNVSIQKSQDNIQYQEVSDELASESGKENINNVLLIGQGNQNIVYEEIDMKVGNKATIQRQMLHQPEIDELGIPVDEIIDHERQLEFKIQRKREQIRQMKNQIKQKQKQNEQKQKRLSQQLENQKNQQQQAHIQSNRHNFIVDMNTYIKDKQLSSIQHNNSNNNDSDAHQSIRTKARNRHSSNIQHNQKSIINPTILIPLDEQYELPFESSINRQKIPGQLIRLIDDTGRQSINLESLNNEEDNPDYVYEVSNNDLNLDDDQIEEFGHNLSRAETNKHNAYIKRQDNVKNNAQHAEQKDFQSSETEVIAYKRKDQHKFQQIPPNVNFSSVNQIFKDDENAFQNVQQLNEDNVGHDQPILLEDADLSSKQQIYEDAVIKYRKQTHSEFQDNPHIYINNKKSAKSISNYDEVKQAFNNNQFKKQLSSSKHKKIPEDKDKQIRVNFKNNYQQARKDSVNKADSRNQKSVLATAAMNNLLIDNENTVLMKKSTTQKHPLVTKQKWQDSYEKQPHDLSSDQIDDQFTGNLTKQIYPAKQTKPFRMDLVVPFQTDKQQTGFTISGMKAINEHDGKNQRSMKRIEDKTRMTPKEIISRKNYAEQVEVYFDREEKDPNSMIKPPKISQLSTRRVQHSKQRPPKPSNQMNNHPSKPTFLNDKKFESQQIFGESQSQSIDRNSTYRENRNNILMGKINDRPENEDLRGYYNRQGNRSNKKSKNSKSRSGFSPKRQENDKNLQRIYMQRLDSNIGRSGSNTKKY